MPSQKRTAPLRLSETGLALLRAAAAHMGLSQAGVIEVLIREYAKREGLYEDDAPARRPRGNAPVAGEGDTE